MNTPGTSFAIGTGNFRKDVGTSVALNTLALHQFAGQPYTIKAKRQPYFDRCHKLHSSPSQFALGTYFRSKSVHATCFGIATYNYLSEFFLIPVSKKIMGVGPL